MEATSVESQGMRHVAGIGYRKALEFLLKDYAISKTPNSMGEISKQPLGQVIDKFISSDVIRTTAKAAIWIGNDEAHYTRKWEDKDISDLKRFIDACVYHIVTEKVSNDALEMINS